MQPFDEIFPRSQPLDDQGRRRLPATDAEKVARAFDVTQLPSGFDDDPYPVYQALLDHAPIHQMTSGSVLLSRHTDLEAVYKDTRSYSSDKKIEFLPKFGRSPLYEHHTTSLVFNDPPLHTRVRRIIAGALTPRAIAEMEQSVTRLVEDLLDQMEQKDNADLIADFASAIPVEVIGNMLAVPRDERGPLRTWSLAILGALEPVPTDEQLIAGNRSVVGFVNYLTGLIADRRRNPGDPDKDVLTRLILGETGGEQLSEIELTQNCIFILNAGHETTTNLIGNGLYTLLQWPAERARLTASLATPNSLIKPAIEEFLRFESSNQLGNRRTTCTVTIGNTTLPADTSLTLLIGAANRDPARFDRPDVLDITRQSNRHLAFASGPHQCVGMNVARLEGRIAIERFLKRFPNYNLASAPKRGGRARFRGFLSLPATLG